MFFKYNSYLISTENVSVVIFDKEKQRLTINFNYPINIKINNYRTKQVSDYLYLLLDDNEREEFFKYFSNNKEYLSFKTGGTTIFVKTKFISYIKTIKNELKIVYNLTHPINIDGSPKVTTTAEFVYKFFDTEEQFNQEVERISHLIKLNQISQINESNEN